MFEPIDLGEFERRTRIRPGRSLWDGADRIVSLRNLKRIVDIRLMNDEYLANLLLSVTLVGDPAARPYEGCDIKRMRADPAMLAVGQTFVEERKLLNLQASFFDIFKGTGAPSGFAKKGAMIILGEPDDGGLAVAHYLPPLVEWHGERHGLLDGMHRGYSAMRIGTTIEVIKICFPASPFPCDFGHWKNVRLVGAKPPKEERFYGLRPDLFRDLKYVGIDG